MSLPATGPRTAYGRCERAVREEPPGASAIARTAWLHGVHGTNFMRTMIGPEEARRPTVATSAGEAAWCDPAREVFRPTGTDPERIRPTTGLPRPRTAPSRTTAGRTSARPRRATGAALHEALPHPQGESPS